MPRLLILLRSAGVGALATLVDLGALAVLVSVLGVSPRVASAPALALGVATQFVGNKLFAFGDRSPRWARQGAQFAAVEALGLALNLLLFDLAVTHSPLPYLAARVLSTSVVYFAVCLPLWSRIFRPELHPEVPS
jgi:putative flippase GtrA